ncbi:MAG: hypothetical protein DWQ36_16230 [Acidobacteria bacterium]|nr:MAG: hypothetical protein DWQ36_16230 [Acidobacteriota bacterium]
MESGERPEAPDGGVTTRRRRHPLRTKRGLSALLALLVVAGTAVVLDLPWTEHRLQQRLETAIEQLTAADLAIEDLEVEPLRLALDVRGVTLASRPGGEGEAPASSYRLEILRTEVSWRPWRGLAVRLVRPRLEAMLLAGAEDDEPAQALPVGAIVDALLGLPHLDVRQGGLALTTRLGTDAEPRLVQLQADGIELALGVLAAATPAPGADDGADEAQQRGALEVASWRLVELAPGGERAISPQPVRTLAAQDLGASRLQWRRGDADRARLQGTLFGALPVRTELTVERLPQPRLRLQLEAEADGETLRQLADSLARREISGDVSLELVAQLGAEQLDLTLRAGSEALTAAPGDAFAFDLAARLEDGALALESLEVEGYGGRLSARGEADLAAVLGDLPPVLAADRQRSDDGADAGLEVEAESLEVFRLAEDLAGRQIPLAAAVSGSTRLEWSRTSGGGDGDGGADAAPIDRALLAAGLRGSGRFELREEATPRRPGLTQISGILTLERDPEMASGAVLVDGTRLRTHGVELELGGSASADDLDLAYVARIEDLAAQPDLRQVLVGIGASPRLAGDLTARGTIRGAPDDPAAIALISGQPRVDGRAFDASGELTADLDRVEISGLELAHAAERWRVQGTVPLRSAGEPWDLGLEADGLRLLPWAPDAVRQRLAVAEGRLLGSVRGSTERHEAEVELVVDPLQTVAGNRGSLTARGQLAGSGWTAWRIDPIRLELADEALLEARVSIGEDQRVTVDLDGRQLPIELLLPELVEHTPTARFALRGDLATRLGARALAELEGDLSARLGGLTVRETSLRDLLARVELAGGEARLALERLEAGTAATLEDVGPRLATGRVELTPPHRGSLQLDLAELDAARLLESILPADAELSLRQLRGEVALEGPLAEVASRPEQLAVAARIDEVVLARPGVELAGADLRIEGSAAVLRFEGLRLRSDLTELEISGSLPLLAPAGSEPLAVRADGRLALDLIDEFVEGLELEGTADVALEIGGSLARPEVTGTLSARGASGSFGAVTWEQASLDVELPRDGQPRAELTAELLGGGLEAEASLRRGFESADLRGGGSLLPQLDSLTFRARAVDLAPLMPLQQQPWRLVVSAGGTLQAPPGEALRGSGQVRLVDLTLGRHQTASIYDAASWELDGSWIRTEPLLLFGNGAEGSAQVAVRWRPGDDDAPPLGAGGPSAQPRLAQSFVADVDARIDLGLFATLGQLDPAFAQVDGPARVEMAVDFGEQGLRMFGRATPEGASFTLNEPTVRLDDLSGEVRFASRTVTVERLTGTSGPGTVELDGDFELTPSLAPGSADLQLYVDRLPLKPYEGLDGLAWAQLRLRSQGPADPAADSDDPDDSPDLTYLLSGRTLFRRGRFSANLASESPEAEALAQIRWADTADEADLLERIRLEIRLSSEDLLVDNDLSRIAVDARLTVTGTAAQPLLSGSIVTSAPGVAYLADRTYEIEQVSITFDDYPEQPPVVRAESLTEASGERVLVRLEGPTDDLAMTLYAPDNPNLTQADLQALLVTGRTATAASEGLTELVAAQAATYLGDLLAGSTGVDLGLFFGTPASIPILTSETDPESRFTVGRSITEDLSIAYSVGLEEAEDRLWILDYRPLRNLWLRAIEEDATAYVLEIASQAQFDTRGEKLEVSRPERRIARVSFEGPSAQELGLQRFADTRIRGGERIRPNELRREAEQIERQLVSAGFLAAEVDADFEEVSGGGPEERRRESSAAGGGPHGSGNGGGPGVDDRLPSGSDASDGSGAIEVVVHVRPGRPYRIEWRGDPVGDELKQWVASNWTVGGAVEPRLAQLGRDVRHRLMAEGWRRAEVVTSFEAPAVPAQRGLEYSADPTLLVFDVGLGERGGDFTLAFTGNQLLGEEQLRAVLPGPDDPKLFALLDDERAQLEQRLALRYAEEGVLRLRVASVTTTPAGNAALEVQVALDESPISLLTAVRFPGATLPSEELLAVVPMRIGSTVDVVQYGESRSELLRHYRDEGFWDTRVRAQLERLVDSDALDEVEAIFTVEEGYRARVREVQWTGDTVTAESVLRAQLPFAPGELVTPRMALVLQRRLYDLGLFRSVSVGTTLVDAKDAEEATPGQAQERLVDVVVELYDKPNIILDYGLRYRARASEVTSRSSQSSETEGFELALRARYLQPFRSGGSGSVSFFPQRDRDVARLRYDRPVFFGRRLNSSAFVEVREDRRPEFDFEIASQSLTLRQSKELFAEARSLDPERPRFELQWGAHYQESKVVPGPDAVEIPELPFNETFRRNQVSLSLIADSRDNYIDPGSGMLWTLSTQAGAQAIGSDFDFVRFYGEAAWYKTLGGEDSPWVWASGAKVGSILTDEDFPFLEDRFTAGGAYSMRGFRTRGLGPQLAGEPIGGRSLTILHQELRFPIRGVVRGGVFLDVGNVFSKPAEFELDDLRRTAGLGIRATLPFGVLRLDWARVLDSGPGEGSDRFHLAFGHAF